MRIDEAILIMENERPHCGDKLTFTEEERYEAYTLALMALRDLQRAYDEGYKQGRYDEKVETETSLPNGEQTHALRTETHACDLISRNAALALVVKAIHGTDSEEIKDYLFGGLRKELWALPSEQLRPKGEWDYSDDMYETRVCSVCGFDTEDYKEYNFCPHCGSYNGGESDEKG